MLTHLRVSNLGVLRDAAIEPADGLTVITGETGAGKTLLLGGLRLMLGEKPDASAVGPFADTAQADGLFATEEYELGVTRVVPSNGRSRAHVDGSIVSAAVLAEKVGSLVEIVGQHDQSSLRKPSRLLSIIDGTLDERGKEHLAEYEAAWSELQELRRRETLLGGNEMTLRQELDLVRFQAAEIEAASLEPGEDVALENEASRHENMFEIQELLAEATTIGATLSEESGELVSRMRKLAGLDTGQAALVDQSEGVAAAVAELLSDVRRAVENLEVDPTRAEEVGQRLTLIGELKRKYGKRIDDVVEFGEAARARQEELEQLLDAASRLGADLEAAVDRVNSSSVLLTDSRCSAAARVAQASESHLADLGLERGRLLVDVEPRAEPGPRGLDRVTILFTSDEHLQPGPISSVASGGELSRLVLAFRLATRAPDTETLVFDEVDSGVGGATALAMGRKLRELADTSQVLCVTHLPQVAAFADAHFVVRRGEREATVQRVTGEERLQEVSRMLAGLPHSQAGQDAASELLSAAGR